jgi:hypothetical protein
MFAIFFINENSNTLLDFCSFTGYEELIAGFIPNDFFRQAGMCQVGKIPVMAIIDAF